MSQSVPSPARLRYLAAVNPPTPLDSGGECEDERCFVPMTALGEWGTIDCTGRKCYAATSGYAEFRSGDVLVAKLTPCFENGKGALVPEGIPFAFGTTEIVTLRPTRAIDGRFLLYTTLSHGFRAPGSGEMYGAAGQKRVPDSFIRNHRVWLPPLDRQRAIAAYLDERSAKIDALIERKRRLIARLHEKRAALITHAVTKGLDPAAPMKDTGVPWLGEVPAHWEVKRLKHVAQCLDSRRIPLNAEARSARQGAYPYWGCNSIQGWIDDYLFDEPMVLLGEDGAPFFDRMSPVAFAVDGKIWVNNHAHVLRPRPSVHPAFLAHALNVVAYEWFIDGTTRDKLTQEKMGGIPVALPPLDEQSRIVAALAAEHQRQSSIESRVETAIARLHEYRTTLVSAAVTGQLAIPAAVPIVHTDPTPDAEPADAATDASSTFLFAGANLAPEDDPAVVLAALVLDEFHGHPQCGRMILHKGVVLPQAIFNLRGIDARPQRDAAGPYDRALQERIDRGLAVAGWWTPKHHGTHWSYARGPKRRLGGGGEAGGVDWPARFEHLTGVPYAAVRPLLRALRDLTKDQIGNIATVWFAWRDLLEGGNSPTKAEIVVECRYRWHKEKETTADADWHAAIGWIEGQGVGPVAHPQVGRGRES